jgi:peptidoglycan hydrolase-like protein with peptidoglycan-binding domain
MKQNNTLLNEEISKIKKMMSIKDGDVILERYTISDFVTRFINNSDPNLSKNDGILNLINLMDKTTFINFVVELNKKTGKNFNSYINLKFKDTDGADALKLQQILKSKFNIDTDASVSGNQYMNPRQRVFKKGFRITNYNNTPQQQQAGYTQAMKDEDSTKIVTKTGPNPTDFVITGPGETPPKEWKPEQAKKETTTTSPQTYNDILSGKGVLKTGVTSPAVGELQQKLLDLGYSAIAKPTNYFGTETLNAVKDFQEKNSLTVDGKVGGNTSKKIDQILDIRKRRSASQGEVVPGVPDTKLPDTSISGLSNQKTTTTSTSPNTRGLTTAVQSYVPKGVSRTADFS